MLTEVRCLTKVVVKNQHENDRRLTRMEVSINKTLVRLGDITRSNAAHSNDDVSRGHYGEARSDVRRYSRGDSRSEERERRRSNINDPRPQRHQSCDMPIQSLNQLGDANQQFKNKDFFTFMVTLYVFDACLDVITKNSFQLNQEKEFCTPSKNSSDTGVITTYLKRFIALRVRTLLTLKELKNVDGFTLFADFRYVYNFLIRVMIEAYKSCKQALTEKEAHEALRIVWGRSKQLHNSAQKNK